MNRAAWLIALVLGGCTATAEVGALNDKARQVGLPKLEFVKQGTGSGSTTVTMPDGEVLHGRYGVATDGGVGIGSGTAFGPRGSASYTGSSTFIGSGGNAYAIANGPKTSMSCQVQVGFGHGGGICRTSDGAEYQVAF